MYTIKCKYYYDVCLVYRGHENNLPIYEFEKLDKFLRKLIHEYKLYPTIEFMTTLKFKELSEKLWEDFAYKIISHYIGKASKYKFMNFP